MDFYNFQHHGTIYDKGHKQCSDCKEWFAPDRIADSFYPRKSTPDKLETICKSCAVDRRKARRERFRFNHSQGMMGDGSAPLPSSKACVACGMVKPMSAFRNTPETIDGKAGKCRFCDGPRIRLKRKRNRTMRNWPTNTWVFFAETNMFGQAVIDGVNTSIDGLMAQRLSSDMWAWAKAYEHAVREGLHRRAAILVANRVVKPSMSVNPNEYLDGPVEIGNTGHFQVEQKPIMLGDKK